MNIIDVGLKFNSNMSKMGIIDTVVTHHSGVKVLQDVKTIHDYHKNHNGWAGIGYHYYIRKDGTIYKGRPEQYAGAHCPGKNSTSIGMCFEGDYNTETMPEVQKQAGKELIADIRSRHNIKFIGGHREFIATSCPGKNFPLEELKNNDIKPIENKRPSNEYEIFVGEVQKACGLQGKNIDYIAGPITLDATITVSAKINRNHKVVTPLERYLKYLGYYNGEIEADKGKTPIFGKGMTDAVKRYQEEVVGFKYPDGEITKGNKTWKKLLKLI